jgi:hypothetical protein
MSAVSGINLLFQESQGRSGTIRGLFKMVSPIFCRAQFCYAAKDHPKATQLTEAARRSHCGEGSFVRLGKQQLCAFNAKLV